MQAKFASILGLGQDAKFASMHANVASILGCSEFRMHMFMCTLAIEAWLAENGETQSPGTMLEQKSYEASLPMHCILHPQVKSQSKVIIHHVASCTRGKSPFIMQVHAPCTFS